MKNYTCQTCSVGILLEPREVEDIGAYCTEHLFSEHLTALNELANLASKEEQRGTSRQEDHRAAETETPNKKESSVMSDSTTNQPIQLMPDDVINVVHVALARERNEDPSDALEEEARVITEEALPTLFSSRLLFEAGESR